MRRIAVDGMGSDHAPVPEVEGCLAAVRKRAVEVILVGDETRLRAEIARHRAPAGPGKLTIHHASQVITMEDAPGTAFKTKKDSSMRVCFNLAATGKADAVVSAGNSGAILACGLFVMKRLPGVERPGLMTIAPTRGQVPCVVLDVGANTDVKAVSLAQFAVLGSVYARLVFGVARPRVAVLSNGEEDSKGTDLTREAHRLLSAAGPDADFEFSGYAEGRDFFSGERNVIVTDGFTGNVALKTSEGTTRFILDMLEIEVKDRLAAKVGVTLLKPALRALKRRLEPDEHGGAPLLGIDGVAVICHGRSTARAIHNAISAAEQLHEAGLAPALTEAIRRHHKLWDEDHAPPAAQAGSGSEA